MYFIYPHHLTSASALPGETGNPEIVFSLKCCMFFYQKHTKYIKIPPIYSWTTLHCQNNQLGAPERT